MGLRARVGVLVALLGLLLPALVFAQNTTTNITAASTFFLDKTETQFSVNIANDSDDVFIYFTSPAYSWVGVGFGDRMEGSLMLIMYPNANGTDVTLSPRIGSKASEPTFDSSVAIDVLPGTQINNEMLILNARCRNCREYLDTKASAHPMIYAFGNGQNLMSDSPSANLKRHVRYGHFTMDMLAATGTGGVPAKSNAVQGVSMGGDMTRDHDRANLAHAVIGCLALFVLWPLNVLFAGFFKNIKIHVVVSMLIMLFLVVSYALGGVTSTQYNRSKAFNTPHQIISFIALVPILALTLLPLPSLTLRLPNLATRLRPLHTPLTAATFILLLLTGGLGLHLSSQTRPIILIYTALSLGVCVFIFTLQSCIRKRGSAHARALRSHSSSRDKESDEMVMLGKTEDSRSGSAASLATSPAYARYGGSGSGSGVFGSDGQYQQQPYHQRSPSRSAYGGGTMPGPQYLLNMHPGVPVQVNRM